MRKYAPIKLANIRATQDSVLLAGFATSVRTIMTKNGKMVAIMLEDMTGKHEVIVRGELVDTLPRETLKADQVLICRCRVREDTFNPDGGLRINADDVFTAADLRTKFGGSLKLYLRPEHDIAAVAELLRPHTTGEPQDRVTLRVYYENEQARGELMPSANWRIVRTPELMRQLEDLLGTRAVEVE